MSAAASASPGRRRAPQREDLSTPVTGLARRPPPAAAAQPADLPADLLPDDPWLPDDAWLARDPVLPEDPWPTEDPLSADDLWLAEGEAPADRPAGVPEIFKAGRWDRSQCSGGGFAAGGLADHLRPGAVLAGLAGDRWADGLGRLADDELIGVLRAARRLASWATAMELAALADLWRRRTTDEDNGETGAAEHAADEVAAALTLTGRGADTQLDLAIALTRLPLTSAALASGAIDAPRAKVIADEATGLTGEHAAAVEQAIIGAAPGQTTGQIRAAAHRAALAADPAAASKRKQEALREARVERWAESAGTAALAGRDLPPTGVLAADAHLTALAEELKAAGVPGTLDTLRAQVYLALLAGTSLATLHPATPGGANTLAGDYRPGSDASADTASGSDGLPRAFPVSATVTRGSVNLTLPLDTWLGLSERPGEVAGYGPVDAADARDLASQLAAHPGNRWCLTLTTPTGQPLAHGCSHTGPPPGGRHTRAGPGTPGQAGPSAPGPPPATTRDRHTRSRDGTWTVTLTPLDSGDCDHTWQTPAYKPTARLRHLVQIRHTTCVFPGCRRPAKQCDADHTIPYESGGPTCLCNLAPLCRRHHRAKQAPRWHLTQDQPGVMTWRLPSGRTYQTAGGPPYPV